METIINFTPTGMIPTKEMTPHVPVTHLEIIEAVHEAVDIGISMVHLHARDPKTELPEYRAEAFARIITGIRKFAPDLVICVSLSGRTYQGFSERADVLSLDGNEKPDMGSLTLSSVNFNRDASMNAPDMITRLAARMKECGIAPELEAFDAGMINFAKYLERKGLITPPHYFNLLLGNIACAQADLLHAGVMIRDLPPQSYWSMAGIGDFQLAMNSIAIACGGGVRVGLEDNIWYDRERRRLARNADLLKRVHRLLEANETSVMPPATLRRCLHLNAGHGRYGCESQ